MESQHNYTKHVDTQHDNLSIMTQPHGTQYDMLSVKVKAIMLSIVMLSSVTRLGIILPFGLLIEGNFMRKSSPKIAAFWATFYLSNFRLKKHFQNLVCSWYFRAFLDFQIEL